VYHYSAGEPKSSVSRYSAGEQQSSEVELKSSTVTPVSYYSEKELTGESEFTVDSAVISLLTHYLEVLLKTVN
jgi:hypothetical protein